MRFRRPAVAATALGLAGALVPATGAQAATGVRQFQHDEVVVVRRPDGSTYDCQLESRLIWNLGGEGPEDDTLFASTAIKTRPDDAFECESVHNVVTLHWHDEGTNTASDFTYTAEGQKTQEVFAPPAFTDDGVAYENPRSEHRWVFDTCAATCEFTYTHTFTPK
jgi:hypothetical protein